jgi:hypothetical protein
LRLDSKISSSLFYLMSKSLAVKLRIPRLGTPIAKEENVVLPIASSGEVKLCISFFEDQPEGRALRILALIDRFDLVEKSWTSIRGDLIFIHCEGIDEVGKVIERQLRVTKYRPTSRIPLYFNVELITNPSPLYKGVRGFLNFTSIFGIPKLNLPGLKLNVEEVIQP